ncbi:MAG TPA: hypothetical protein DEP18_05780 [Flavobacteriales bacterium]|nr:hypothetical protein [Flavobacteriales bacterium]HRE73866.1 hypothetical protein [Flavobacteriales bacterium]HRE98401.1 hypothetical protein [Flavobacteriales bacterium]HRJ34523.1 hypothetical protein [Flavobacteriales bacterium]HRJ39738.1 hypothetical protein [Flavobacteriales bacterium]
MQLFIATFFFLTLAPAGVENQNQIALSQFKDGDLQVGKVTATEKRPNDKFIEQAAKTWPVKFVRDGNRVTEIIVNRAGVVEEKFTPDVPGFPAYFVYNSTRLTMTGNVMYYYNWKNAAPEIKYVLALDYDAIRKKTLDEHHKILQEYLTEAFANQTNARGDMAAEQQAKAEKEKAENSIKGKDIKKIEVVWITPSSEAGMQSKIKYGIKATAADGKIFSTPGLGGKTPFDDFEITTVGAQPADEFLMVEVDASKIKNDQISLTAKSKFHSISGSASLPLSYSTPIVLSFRGEPGCGTGMYAHSGRGGGRGKSIVVNAGLSTNGKLVLVEVKDATSSEVLARLKVQPGVSITIDISGGDGCSGSSSATSRGGDGGAGGSGGNAVVNKSSSVSGLSLNIINKGGRGGKGGKGSAPINNGSEGSSGSNGNISENNQTITLNF